MMLEQLSRIYIWSISTGQGDKDLSGNVRAFANLKITLATQSSNKATNRSTNWGPSIRMHEFIKVILLQTPQGSSFHIPEGPNFEQRNLSSFNWIFSYTLPRTRRLTTRTCILEDNHELGLPFLKDFTSPHCVASKLYTIPRLLPPSLYLMFLPST